MAVRIVTDSIADLPPNIVKELGITVIPLIVRFGTEVYRDGVDMTSEQFYERLVGSKVMPATSVPPPAVFADTYDKLAEETDEVLVITVSSRLSATHDVALQAKKLMRNKCRVEVFDSKWATMAEGFVAITAARAAKSGASLNEAIAAAKKAIPRVSFLAAFDTLEYLQRGGRIGKAQALLGSMLKINPLITLKDGVIEPAGRTRSRAKAIDRLYDFVMSYSHIDELAIGDTASPDEAEALVERLNPKFPRKRIYRSKMTPAIGTHTGPHLLLVAVMGDKD